MNKGQLLTTLRTQVSNFLSDLRCIFPSEADLLIMSVVLGNEEILPTVDIMRYIQSDILPLKQQITSRNERFFLDHNVLFEKLDTTKVNRFKELWLSPAMDADNKNMIWAWFDLFVRLAERYADASV